MNGIEGSNPKAALFSLANQRRDVMMTRFLDAWDFDRYSHLMTIYSVFSMIMML